MRAFLSLLILVLALIAPLPAASQGAQDDRGYLQRLLENGLSDAGREVRITGFEGAFSSRARAARITIADARGIWLRLDDVAMKWDRAALLSGRLEIGELSAARITLSRWPEAARGAPTPEARPFRLPELPLAIRLGRIAAGRIDLGAPILGQPVSLSLAGSAMLEGGAGRISLALQRQGGPGGEFRLDAGYSNATGIADLDLSLSEEAGGIAASLIHLAGRGGIALSLRGEGPLDAFQARLDLSTGNARRLSGTLTLGRKGAGAEAPLAFSAHLQGDVRQMLAPEYRAFFGQETRLDMEGAKQADGRVSIERLELASAAMQASMRLELAASGWPLFASIRARIGTGATPSILPLPGPVARLGAARLSFSYDAAKGDAWSGMLMAEGFRRGEMRLTRLSLRGAGRITASRNGAKGAVDGRLAFEASGISPADPALSAALGPAISGEIAFAHAGGGALDLPDIRILGSDYSLEGHARIAFLAGELGMRIGGAGKLGSEDLSRFSALAGMKLSGKAGLGFEGHADLPSGAFDLKATGQTEGLHLGQPQLDALLSGAGRLSLDAKRAENGLDLRVLELETGALRARAHGMIASAGSALSLDAGLADGRALFEGLPGRLSLSARLRDDGAADGLAIRASLLSQSGGKAALNGHLAPDLSRAALALTGAAPLALANPYLKPRQLDGEATFDLRLDGPLRPASLSGHVETRQARLALPALGTSLERIGAKVQLGSGQADLTLGGELSSGGHVRVSGLVDLSRNDLPADLRLRIEAARLSRADLYRVRLDGEMHLAGALTGGAEIGGKITLAEAELRVPETAPGAAEGLRGVIHINEPRESRASRERAGLLEEERPSEAAGPAYALDLDISAPARIFLRGRGLDAELGGAIHLGGTSADIVPRGSFALIRGRLDILGKRLTLKEGSATLRGNFDPYLQLLAQSRADDTLVRIRVSGRAGAPEVSFSSVPPLPQEEVLARLIFGRGLSRLSPLQALRLASAIATLAGHGGGSVIDRLRQRFGLDDLDITTTEDGTAGARLGRYLGENIYSEITVDSEGAAEIDLKLNLSPTITARGRVNSGGESSLGLFFEKDY